MKSKKPSDHRAAFLFGYHIAWNTMMRLVKEHKARKALILIAEFAARARQGSGLLTQADLSAKVCSGEFPEPTEFAKLTFQKSEFGMIVNQPQPENGPPPKTTSVVNQLLSYEEIAGDKRLAQRLASVLEFTQLLYDDDENLTRVGNLSGVAKDKLQSRVLEIFDMVEEDADLESDEGQSEEQPEDQPDPSGDQA